MFNIKYNLIITSQKHATNNINENTYTHIRFMDSLNDSISLCKIDLITQIKIKFNLNQIQQ